jgi:hypothetical protein
LSFPHVVSGNPECLPLHVVSRGRSRGPVFGVLIALVIVITCGIMLPYRNITGDSPLNKTERRYGLENELGDI